MRIRANIANGYPMVYELKQTHVLNQDGHALMKQVMLISDTYKLNPEEALGYIIYRLHPQPLQFQPQPTVRTVRIDYTDDDTNVDAWYGQSEMSNNQLSTQFILMWMRLMITYGNSLSELLYLLRQVANDANWTPQVPQPEMPMGMPMGYGQIGYGQMNPMGNQMVMQTPMANPTATMEPKQQPKPKRKGFKIRHVPNKTKPAVATAEPETTSNATTKSDAPATSSEAEAPTVSPTVASLKARQAKLAADEEETDDVIKQNPMFAAFYNRNDK